MGFTRLNGVYGTVGTQSNSGSTSVVLGSGQGAAFAAATTTNPIRCAVIDTSTQPETLKFFLDVTGRSTDTLTVAHRGVTDGNVSSADANILVGYTIAAVTTVGVLDATYQALALPGYDVFLCAGQSNMAGSASSAPDSRLDPAPVAGLYVFPATGTYANQVVSATEPLGYPEASTGISPAMEFGRWYTKMTGRRALLVPVARGGTPFEGASSPTGYTWKTSRTDVVNLYLQAIDQGQVALAAAGPGSRVAGILWLQGETDSDNHTSAATYQTDLDALVDGLRTAFGDNTIPFVIAGMLPEAITASAFYADVASVHSGYPTHKAYTAYFAGPGPGSGKVDNVHYTNQGLRLVGESFYYALLDAQANTTATGSTSRTVAVPPDVVTGLSATANTSGSTTVTWTAPTASGGAALTDYTVQYRLASSNGAWSSWTHAASTSTSATITGLTAATAYSVRVAAVNSAGAGVFTTTTAAATGPINDPFTRADSATTMGSTPQGHVWTPVVGLNPGASGVPVWGISSNRASIVSLDSGGDAIALVDRGVADTTVGVDLTVIGATKDAGLVFRATDGNNCYVTAQTILYKVVAGVLTSLGTFSQTFVQGDHMDVVLAGTSITIKRNGTTVLSVTDSTYTSQTKVGMFGDSTSNRYDNFTAS